MLILHVFAYSINKLCLMIQFDRLLKKIRGEEGYKKKKIKYAVYSKTRPHHN